MQITLTIEETVLYSLPVDLPEGVETDEQVQAWVDENGLDAWAQGGHPVENFSSVEEQTVREWEPA